MRLSGLGKAKKIYFIGIGGISMSALAKFLSTNGYDVSGSDEYRGEETERVSSYGVQVFIGTDGTRERLRSADIVVYTDAIPETHAELLCAKRERKQLYSRAELLSIICKEFPHVLSVAGSHGKTTCTSMCAHIFNSASLPFTAHIGGEDLDFGNFYTTGREYFVTEACEYKKNLLKVSAEIAVLLNIDQDHMECYDGENDLVNSFRVYCESATSAFVCADDKKCQSLGDFPCFGIENPLSDYRAVDLRAVGECYSFTVEEYGKQIGRIRLKAIGRCNVYNALAAFSACRALGLNEKEIITGLENFRSVNRRFEKIGAFCGASVVCDYAHHPREIESTVRTALGICRGQLYVVFQPHTYSRTKLLLNEFVQVLRSIKNLVVYKTYPAREKYDEEGSAQKLSRMVGDCLYAENAYVLKTWMQKTLKEGDLVLFLGAGDIYYVAQYLLKEPL